MYPSLACAELSSGGGVVPSLAWAELGSDGFSPARTLP